MKIGDEVYVHGYVDEIRKDVIIIRNDGGYFGTVPSEINCSEPQTKYPTEWCEDCNLWREDNCMGVAQCKANMEAVMKIYEKETSLGGEFFKKGESGD